MATYYVNKFNDPSTDNWHFAVWRVVLDKSASHKVGPISYKWYIWKKILYDPKHHFKKDYSLDPLPDTIARGEKELIARIFEIGDLKGIKAKR